MQAERERERLRKREEDHKPVDGRHGWASGASRLDSLTSGLHPNLVHHGHIHALAITFYV